MTDAGATSIKDGAHTHTHDAQASDIPEPLAEEQHGDQTVPMRHAPARGQTIQPAVDGESEHKSCRLDAVHSV